MTKQLIVVLLMLSCTGCMFFCREIDNNPPLSPHHFCYNELEMNWQAEQTADGTRIAGTARNLSSQYLQNLELSARLVNKQGKIIARETFVGLPDYLAPAEKAPFNLVFHLPTGTQVNRVHFSYTF